MTTDLPSEVVEAAARAMHAARYPRFEWDGEDKAVKGLYRDRARAALGGALPLLPDVGDLLAELDRLRAATVKPDRDTIARALEPADWRLAEDPRYAHLPAAARDSLLRRSRESADVVLAVLPGRTEAQVKAEALREAADGYFPLDVRHHARGVRSWLRGLAARIEGG